MTDIILRLYLLFEGRMTRMNFFTYTFILYVAVGLVKFISLNVELPVSEKDALILSVLITCMFMFLWSILIVRRLHDLDKPGKYIWRMTVPVYNIYFLFVLLLMKGTDGDNQYGANSVLPRLK